MMADSNPYNENKALLMEEEENGFEVIRKNKRDPAIEAARIATARAKAATARAKAATAIIGASTTDTTTYNNNDNRASFSSASDFSSSRKKQTTWGDENGAATSNTTPTPTESTKRKDLISPTNTSEIRDFTYIGRDRSLFSSDNQGVLRTDDNNIGMQTAENNTLTLIDSVESVEVEYVPSSNLDMSQPTDAAAAAVPSFDVVPSGSELPPPPPPPPGTKKKSRMKTLLSKARPRGTADAPQPQVRMINDDKNMSELIGMDLSKLLQLCEQVIATEEESLLRSKTVLRTESQRILRADAAIGTHSSWEDIRFWLRKHPTNADRRKALLDYKDEYGATPLHLICRHGRPPSDILHTIIQAAPDACSLKDSFQWLPLHYACASTRGTSEKVIAKLVDKFPQATIAKDLKGRTPLHYVLASVASKQQVLVKQQANEEQHHHQQPKGLIFTDDDDFDVADSSEVTADLTPEAIRLLVALGASTYRDDHGMLPCHYACRYLSLAPDALRALIKANPEALTVLDDLGRPPIHLVMGNADKTNAVATMSTILQYDKALTQQFINIYDMDGHLPIHILAIPSQSTTKAIKTARSPKETALARERCESLKQCLTMYLDAEPNSGAIFLTGLQTMPSWLIDASIRNSYLQKILNNMITRRFPTAVLLIDLYVLILMIVVFWVASSRCISNRESCGQDQKHLLSVLYGGATYYLIRELAQALSMQALGLFKRWACDTKNWIVVITFCFVYADTAVMQFGLLSNPARMQALVALTLAMLCVCFISFLKFIMVGLAVFVHGVLFVVGKLWAFLVCLGVIIVAFSLMFVNLFRGSEYCPPYMNEDGFLNNDPLPQCPSFPFCSFKDASLACTQMLVKQLIPNGCFPTHLSLVFFATYIFGVVLLLINVLIAIVIDSYSLIQNERSTTVFWSSRLDFVGELCAMSTLCINTKRLHQGKHLSLGSQSELSADSKAWKQLLSFYEDQELNWRSFDFFAYLMIRIFCAVVLIPCWLLFGLVTAGALWPQQIREYLLLQKTAIDELQAEDDFHGFYELADLKENLMAFKKGARSQMQSNREAVVSFCEEADEFQRLALADLAQVREVMQSMLEIRRSSQKMGRRRKGFHI